MVAAPSDGGLQLTSTGAEALALVACTLRGGAAAGDVKRHYEGLTYHAATIPRTLKSMELKI